VFHFLSVLSPGTAYGCVTSTLRRQGFELVEGAPGENTVVALRQTTPTTDHGAEWWQITSSVTQAQDGRTEVHSVVGSAPDRAGPFSRPSAELSGTLGVLAARCTWPRTNPTR
jgi:hypothetical protein